MSNFHKVNPNPQGGNVGDCTVRAISLATGQDWEDIYLDLCIHGFTMADMPSSNSVWGSYLVQNGWKYNRLQDTCPFCYTVNDFAEDHKEGTFIVGTGTHVVCIKDGQYWDSWDSGDKVPLFYFERE